MNDSLRPRMVCMSTRAPALAVCVGETALAVLFAVDVGTGLITPKLEAFSDEEEDGDASAEEALRDEAEGGVRGDEKAGCGGLGDDTLLGTVGVGDGPKDGPAEVKLEAPGWDPKKGDEGVGSEKPMTARLRIDKMRFSML